MRPTDDNGRIRDDAEPTPARDAERRVREPSTPRLGVEVIEERTAPAYVNAILVF